MMEDFFDQYLKSLQKNFNQEGEIHSFETKDINLGMVEAIAFSEVPESKLYTSFSYGLSKVIFNDVDEPPVEVCLTVNSKLKEWIHALGYLVEWNRKSYPFYLGSLFNFGKNISPDSAMDSFLVFQPLHEKLRNLSTSKKRGEIRAIYPLYNGEVQLLKKIGIKKFFGLREFEPYNVNRSDLSVIYKVNF